MWDEDNKEPKNLQTNQLLCPSNVWQSAWHSCPSINIWFPAIFPHIPRKPAESKWISEIRCWENTSGIKESSESSNKRRNSWHYTAPHSRYHSRNRRHYNHAVGCARKWRWQSDQAENISGNCIRWYKNTVWYGNIRWYCIRRGKRWYAHKRSFRIHAHTPSITLGVECTRTIIIWQLLPECSKIEALAQLHW